MAYTTGAPIIGEWDLYTSNLQPVGGLYVGQILQGKQGKFFKYLQAGGVALVTGNVLQSAVIDTQFNSMVVPTAVVANGITSSIVVTNGTTAVVLGDFIGATAVVAVTPGIGQEYTIIGHSAALSGAALTLQLDRPLRVSLGTASRITLRKSAAFGVIQAPATTLTGIPVATAINPIAISGYGFGQVGGMAGVLADSTSILVGSDVASPSGTAGAVTLGVAGKKSVGTAYQAANSGVPLPIDLHLI